VTFLFDIPNRQDINRERLNKEFLGLSVTLSLLQEQVTNLPSIIGKTGMRQSTPRTALPINIPMDAKKNTHNSAAIVAHPNTEFHTQSSLLNRIWISINHRWLALYATEHLFREENQPWSYQEALVYSFQMMAPCGPVRYEFLSPLVGYCLRFRTQDNIESKRGKLREIWKDPSSFLSYGNTCLSQFSSDAQTRIMVACFKELRSDIPATSRRILYNRDSSWTRRWNILCAYIFHFWLDSASNNNIKCMVMNVTYPNPDKKKRKRDAGCTATESTLHEFRLSTSSKPISHNQDQLNESRISKLQSKRGIQSIILSRRESDPLPRRTSTAMAPTPTHKEVPPAVSQVDSKIGASLSNDSNPISLQGTNWNSLRLITDDELKNFVQSYLLIHRHDGVHVLSELSPLEVYSANHLHDLMHSRVSGKSPFFPLKKIGPIVLHVRPDADCFIDTHAKSYHIAREQCECFNEHSQHLPTIDQIQSICKAIVHHGHIDNKRAVGQYRVNIGNGGQNWQNGAPCRLHGMQFQKDLEKDGKYEVTEVLQSIGQLAEFTWRVMCALQNDASDHPIAPDSRRKLLYASHLNEYLSMDREVGFEDLTLVVSSLFPVIHEVSPHRDTMNDTLAGYTRTAVFNMVMIEDTDNVARPTILHFQVICNFRKVIGRYVIPFYNFLSPVAQHAQQYMEKWHRNIHSIYAGKTERVPSFFDRSGFFLDDTLEYTTIKISDQLKHKQTLSSEYLLTEINISRTLSLSMFIDPIVELQGHIKFDQTIELAFVCSFLSNPLWFNWTFSSLIKRLDSPINPFAFGLHPFYDSPINPFAFGLHPFYVWAETTIDIFGTWQGGPYNRWSPCGGTKETVLETFGAHPGATKEERTAGEGKLSQVVSILLDHVNWINSLSGSGTCPVVDMPLSSMKARCHQTINEISKIASCQFSHFRLGILTTILSGCGLLKDGKHLRHIMYPVKGSASFKHLSYPVADIMSLEKACALGKNNSLEPIMNDGIGRVEEEHHDLFMQYLSSKLGFKYYLHDEIECVLCESHPLRSLNCRDWFRKGMSLYDCNEKGEFFTRKYGKDTSWVKLQSPQQCEFAYLRRPSIEYISLDAGLSYYADDFGKQLRSNTSRVKFKGRNSKTSNQQRSFTNIYNTKDIFCRLSMKMADFFIGSDIKRTSKRSGKIQSIFVLGDAEHAVETSSCNDLDDYDCGKHVHGYVKTLLKCCNQESNTRMAAGCYHMDSKSNGNEVTFFPGHLDKPFVHTVWFVPLGSTAFFTVISVPPHWDCVQDPNSLERFDEWKSVLSDGDCRRVNEFLHDFDIQSRKHMRHDSLVRLIYLNICGSVLSFPANRCFHATITPKKRIGFPRDMFIFHPLDGIST